MDRSGNAVKPKKNGRYICESMINFISKAKELMINIQQGNLFWEGFCFVLFFDIVVLDVFQKRDLTRTGTLKHSNWVCHSKNEESKCIKHTFYGSKWSGYVVVNLTRSATVEWKSQH